MSRMSGRRFLVVIVAILLAGIAFMTVVVTWVDEASESYKLEKMEEPKRTCIDNHVYLVAASSIGMAMAPALNDDGTPVRCE